MTGSHLLDTSFVVALIRGDETARRRLAEAEAVFVSAVVLGELHYGAEKSQRPESQRAKIAEIQTAFGVLSCDAETGRFYGLVKNRLRRKGKPIPEGDLWIAATALQYGLPLVARDGHFRDVDDLVLVAW